MIGYAAAALAGTHRRAAALATMLATLAFGLLIFPLLEFANACDVGTSFVLDASC